MGLISSMNFISIIAVWSFDSTPNLLAKVESIFGSCRQWILEARKELPLRFFLSEYPEIPGHSVIP